MATLFQRLSFYVRFLINDGFMLADGKCNPKNADFQWDELHF